MLPKGAACLLLLALSLGGTAAQSLGASSRFYLKRDHHSSHGNDGQNRRSFEVAAAAPRHDTAVFDPDVLNRFLEEYASKMKRTTERTTATYDDESKIEQEGQDLEAMAGGTSERNVTDSDRFRDELSMLNDTIKRHKFYGANSQSEDRNTGWVTLDAIPWSKSKISKWQANPTTQGPWPDSKPWDKPSYNKPWNSDFPSRPGSYESSKPWQNKLTKPHWSDNSAAASNKPWYSQDRPRPGQSDRPSYPAIDKYEENPNQAQKWPPERPSWDRFGDSPRPSSDIITDNGPPNFPGSSWDRPGQRPSYTHHTESYVNEHGGWHDRNDFPSGASGSKYGGGRPGPDDGYYDRPHFSHYKYPASSSDHPTNHPSSGDGQWVLLSTNRGYSKSRQRSIKLDAILNLNSSVNGAKRRKLGTGSATSADNNHPGEEENVPAVTSKRQVRLTVLPSINGTNTTTSHGGLLEVERTFKTVDQSQKEYEMERNGNGNGVKSTTNRSPLMGSAGILVNRRPIRNTLTGGNPSSSAVLAAVGAGMLPATMAMVIPMMLGRRKRSLGSQGEGKEKENGDEGTRDAVAYIRLPRELFVGQVRRRRI